MKLVKLAPKGAATTKELMEEYRHLPPEIVALPPVDVDELIRLFEKLLASAPGPNSGSGVIAEAAATA